MAYSPDPERRPPPPPAVVVGLVALLVAALWPLVMTGLAFCLLALVLKLHGA